MTLVALGLVLAVQQPAKAVSMSATLGGKPYGTVTYVRQPLTNGRIERTVTLDVKEEETQYRIEEKRVYGPGGAPVSVLRTYTEGERKILVSLTYTGNKVSVVFTEGGVSEGDEVTLDQEKGTVADPSQFWFLNGAPAEKSVVDCWEYSIDDNDWVERKVKYEGVASLKIGEKTVQAHRISIGADVNWYVDDQGMPYKSVQKTAAGDLVLVRTAPEVRP